MQRYSREAIGNGGRGYGMSAFNWHNARIGGTHEPTIFSRYVISWTVVGVALALAVDAVVVRQIHLRGMGCI